jgi:hypothetical protein
MRYDHFTMLPERAFQPICGRMTLEGGGGGKSSSPPPPPPPAPPPQQAQAPDVAVARDKVKNRMAGGMAASSPNNTMLTGPEGVDPTALALGKNTLLGG